MKILEFFYNEDTRRLSVEFSTKSDRDTFYRELELQYEDIVYYSPDIISEYDLKDIDSLFVIGILEEYLKENELPEEQSL